jgi:hypothetical protein
LIPGGTFFRSVAGPRNWGPVSFLGGAGALATRGSGSATLVHSLIEKDLVDELRLMVFPVMIGGGKRPFPESRQKKPFKPTDAQTFGSGVAVHTYEPA